MSMSMFMHACQHTAYARPLAFPGTTTTAAAAAAPHASTRRVYIYLRFVGCPPVSPGR